MSQEVQLIDDEIARAAFDLLIREPFYAHVLAGLPRVVTDAVKTLGLHWDGQQAALRVNPGWFRRGLGTSQRKVALKHEVLHLVFRHPFRPADRDPALYSIAADLVVNQLLAPLQPLPDWPALETFPELELPADQPVEVYYQALAALHREMKVAGFGAGEGEETGGGGGSGGGKGRGKPGTGGGGRSSRKPEAAGGGTWAKATGKPESAGALGRLLGEQNRGDDSGWHDGRNGLEAAGGRYAVGSLLIRARERLPAHQWGSLPDALLSELQRILAERQPKLDWKRVVRLFCASSGRTRIRHTVKRVSRRYGTRPGIKVQRLQRLLVAVDTSGSIDQPMLEAFFTEIHAAWRAGATVHVVECDAAVQRDYRYTGRPPSRVAGGGGTEFEPVFRWMRQQAPFDGCLYLTDGCGPAPATRPRCKLLWVIAGEPGEAPAQSLPFGASIHLPLA